MITYNQQTIATNAEGFLLDHNQWNEAVAQQLAAQENLVLTAEHWLILHFLRDFYQKYQHTPPVRMLVKELAKQLGAEKGTSIYLHTLFPAGPAKQASKIAGLPKPARCI